MHTLLAFRWFSKYKNGKVFATKVTRSYPWFDPATCEEARMALLMQKWDLVLEITKRILDKDSMNIEGLLLQIYVMLCSAYNATTINDNVSEIIRCVELKEPQNANIYFQVSQAIARLAGRGETHILQKTILMVERACKLMPEEVTYMLELAYQQSLIGNYKEAISNYRLVSEMNKENVEAICGVVQCSLFLQDFDEAEQLLHFISELFIPSKDLVYLQFFMAQLEWLKRRDLVKCHQLLDAALESLTKGLRSKKGYYFYVELNPDRLVAIAYMYFSLSIYGNRRPDLDSNDTLMKCANILDMVLGFIPAFIDANLLLGRTMFYLGNLDVVLERLQIVLRLDASCASAYLLEAQTYVEQEEYDLARRYLCLAMTHQNAIHGTVLYHVLQAKIHIHACEAEKALKVLSSGLSLPEINHRVVQYTSSFRRNLGTLDKDGLCVYLLLAKLYMQFNHHEEAAKIIDKARRVFRGTPEEVLLIIAESEHLSMGGNIDEAMSLLEQIPFESSYYASAKSVMANILLRYKHNKFWYSACYTELGRLIPSAKNCFSNLNNIRLLIEC